MTGQPQQGYCKHVELICHLQEPCNYQEFPDDEIGIVFCGRPCKNQQDVIPSGAIFDNTKRMVDEIRESERDKVLDEAIEHWEQVIAYGKGVSYNHPVTYEWMYRGVVDYLKKLRQAGEP